MVAVLSLVAGCTASPGATDRAVARARQVLEAPMPVDRVARQVTVRVRNRACGELRTGSGVVVADDLIVTNRHVVEGAQEVQVSTWDGRSVDVAVSEVATDSDLGLLRVDGDLPPAVDEAEAELEAGDPATVAGYPGGEELAVVEGAVLGTADQVLDETEPVLVIDAEVQPGNSGGPVLSDAGELAGVVFAADLENRTALAIPLSRYRELRDGASFSAAPACSDAPAGDEPPPALGDLVLPPAPAPTVPVACPVGEPRADVTSARVDAVAGDPTRWTVTASGAVANPTTSEATLREARLEVVVAGGTRTELAVPVDPVLPGGATTPWSVQGEVSSAEPPTPAGLVLGWLWSDPGLRLRCP